MASTLKAFLHARGWNPLAPSSECIEATVRPAMPEHLTALDKLGVHRQLIAHDMLHLFRDELHDENWPEDSMILTDEATLHALREAGTDLRRLSTDDFEKARIEVSEWLGSRFRDSYLKCEEILRQPRTKIVSEVEAEVGPAFTFWKLWFEKGWTDFEGNRKAAARILRLSEQRGILGSPLELKKLNRDLATLPEWTDDQVEKLIDLLTAKDPGQHIFVRGRGRTVRLGEEEGRDALEKVITPVEPVREQIRRRASQTSGQPTGEDADPKRPTERKETVEGLANEVGVADREPNPYELLADVDEAVQAREWLKELHDREEAGSERAVAAEWILRQATDSCSVEAAARDAGLNAVTLRRHVREIRAELGNHLRRQVQEE